MPQHTLRIRVLTMYQAKVGEALYAELEKLATKYPDYVQNLRGKGYGYEFREHNDETC